uniref:Ubiquitin-like domain-containing protein n=1 Tax=Setaria italica TaxID=4555 RepID=K4AIG2_SETIT
MRMAVADYMIPGPKRTITLEVEAGDTVASVMEQVQRRRGYPVALQFLTCDDTPMRPDGGATLAGYNIHPTRGTKLNLEKIFASATRSYYQMASHQSRRGKDTMEIFARNWMTQEERIASTLVVKEERITTTLVVKPTDTIYSVMAKMEEITGPPADPAADDLQRQIAVRLHPRDAGGPQDRGPHESGGGTVFSVFGWNRLQEKTLKALGIAAVEEKMMRLAVADYIPSPARTITLEVEAGHTVASVMEQVQRRRRNPVAMQDLTCDGRPIDASPRRRDSGGLQRDRGLEAGATLTIDSKTVIVLEVERSDTISSVMAQLEDKLGVPPVMQWISCNERSLRCDDAGTLADHGVQKESTLFVFYSPGASWWYERKVETLKSLGIVDVERADDGAANKMEIFVRDCLIPCCRGRRVRTIVLEVEAGDTVASVMAQVQGRLGYPPALQSLFYNMRELLHDSGGTLADYNVRDGSVLKLDMSRRVVDHRHDGGPQDQGEREPSAARAAAGRAHG